MDYVLDQKGAPYTILLFSRVSISQLDINDIYVVYHIVDYVEKTKMYTRILILDHTHRPVQDLHLEKDEKSLGYKWVSRLAVRDVPQSEQRPLSRDGSMVR